ncbi:hypothetical protein, partial [Arcticibacter eurypsychrophilus]|uniref:hypothetical protein n=1 Tax=Arcticibacter eurypsychrophilus TaxID=1434752 RepID=UPI001B8C5F68
IVEGVARMHTFNLLLYKARSVINRYIININAFPIIQMDNGLHNHKTQLIDIEYVNFKNLCNASSHL